MRLLIMCCVRERRRTYEFGEGDVLPDKQQAAHVLRRGVRQDARPVEHARLGPDRRRPVEGLQKDRRPVLPEKVRHQVEVAQDFWVSASTY